MLKDKKSSISYKREKKYALGQTDISRIKMHVLLESLSMNTSSFQYVVTDGDYVPKCDH